MRVLIADDDVVSRRRLEGILINWGYEVVVASDGLEAWNLLRSENAPRLAILDWMMPGLTGPEVCAKIREDGKNEETYTYVLLLTSKHSKEDLIEGMNSGADDYITKSCDDLELKVRLRAGTRIVDQDRQLREQATKDSLTNIWNRASVLDIMQRELARGFRELRPVGVVLADLDHFKAVNDTYGHFAGDAVLREFTRRMILSIRPYDAIGRYGGEEFLIVLPGCDEAATCAQAERMRLALALDPLMINDVPHEITCSMGATGSPAGVDYLSDTLIRVADEALYEAKHQGRNRTVYYSPLQPQADRIRELVSRGHGSRD